MVKVKSKAKVFAVHKFSTYEGKKHRVIYSKTGNLNTGKMRHFSKIADAKKFGKKKAKELNASYVDNF